jgi:hypothetical protein
LCTEGKAPIAAPRKGGYHAPIKDAAGEKMSSTAGINPKKPIIQIMVITTGLEDVSDVINNSLIIDGSLFKLIIFLILTRA